jgi:hypothetical protein
MIVKLNNVRLSFPDLWEATQFHGTGPFSYKAAFLFKPDSAEHKAITAAIEAVMTEKFKAKAKSVIADTKDNSQKCCLYSGDSKSYEGYEGMMVLSTTRRQEDGMPLILGGGPDRKSPLSEKERGMIYGGCYVNASVDIWAQNNEFGKAARAQLRGIQFLRDGDSFGAGVPVSDNEFDSIEAPDDLA